VGHVLQSRLRIQKVLRTSTHPVRSRTQSEDVVRCRFVFEVGGANSPIQNPAYAPPSAHLLYPQKRQVAAADCRRRFRFSSGATIGGVDIASRGNSKSLANVLRAQYRRFKDDALAMRPSESFPPGVTHVKYRVGSGS
jgi:hypothetical protein